MHAFLWSFVGVISAVDVLASRREKKHICFWRVVVVQVLYYCATCSIAIIIIIMFLSFGSFELNLVLWCDVVVVVVVVAGDSSQISWQILKFLCRHQQQQHLEQKFFERAFEDCTLIFLSRLLDSSTELLFRRAWHTYKQSMQRVLDGFVLRVWQSLLKLYTGLLPDFYFLLTREQVS